MNISNPIFYMVLAATAALIPLALGLFTSYLKISIVLGMIKNALGTQQAPGGLVVMAVSLALTLVVMGPVVKESAELLDGKGFESLAKKPLADSITQLLPAFSPWEKFIRSHCGVRELKAIVEFSRPGGDTPADGPAIDSGTAPFSAVLPAFVLTELKEGFSMAFILLLPFLVVDLIVSNVLAGLGMFSLSPAMISLPLKLIVFVMADGWLLLARGLIASYQV